MGIKSHRGGDCKKGVLMVERRNEKVQAAISMREPLREHIMEFYLHSVCGWPSRRALQ